MIANWFEEVSQQHLALQHELAKVHNTEGLSFVKRGDADFSEICEYLALDQNDVYALQFETYTGDYTNVYVSFGNLLKWFRLERYEVDNYQTKVNFRRDKYGVFALMPELPELNGRCTVYTPHGHTSGYYGENIDTSKPVTDDDKEASQLYRAMLQAGYNVKRIYRYTYSR